MRLFLILMAVYAFVLLFAYIFQERFLFAPSRLESGYKFDFEGKFDEMSLSVDNAVLNGLHFYAHKPKGAVLFFHGNAGSLKGWGKFGKFYTDLGFDFYIFDYRGYGKSSGKIVDEADLIKDSEAMMRWVLEDFNIADIRLVGYSLGSGLAANVATKFGVKELVLISPYFKFDELVSQKALIVPKFLIKYKIPTFAFIKEAKTTHISIIHGKFDKLIKIVNSYNLARYLKQNDKFYEIEAGHNDILSSAKFEAILKEILSK